MFFIRKFVVKCSLQFIQTSALPKLERCRLVYCVSIRNSTDIAYCTQLNDDNNKTLGIIDKRNSINDELSTQSFIKNMLNLNQETVKKIFTECPALREKSLQNVINNYFYLRQAGFPNTTIQENIFLLTWNEYFLWNKLINKDLQNMRIAIQSSNVNLSNTENDLCSHANGWQDTMPYKKLQYLTEKLEASEMEVYKIASKQLIITRMSCERIDLILKILYDHNVSKKSILRNLWLFRYSAQTIKDRLALVKQHNGKKIMPWMISCSRACYTRKMQIIMKKQKCVKENIIEFLARKLNISANLAEKHTDRRKFIQRMRISTLNEKITLLQSYGYANEDILQSVYVTARSNDILKHRITLFRIITSILPPLYSLSFGSKRWIEFMKKNI